MILIHFLILEILLLLENEHPEKAKLWLSISAIIPILGFIIYLIIGYGLEKQNMFKYKHLENRKFKQKVRKQQDKLSEEQVVMGKDMDRNKKLVRLSQQNSLAPLRINNKIEILTNGNVKFDTLLEELGKAREHIHIEYYIFRDDNIGQTVRDLLIRKSLEGIEVKLIIDGVGSHGLSKRFMKLLENANIEVKWFFPVCFPFLTPKLNYRNHRKIVVIDGRIGFMGGFNVGDEYLSRDPKLGFWRDTHLMVKGDSVHVLQSIFLNDWFFVTGEQINESRYYPTPKDFGRQLTQIVPGGPDSEQKPIHQMFFSALANAEYRIWIETPYFIPDDSIMMALKTASLSGVDVRLIVQGIPDHKISYWASQSYFADLLNAGIKIYKYVRGILHSKVVIIDNSIGIVGSANLDIRSFKLDFEISAIFYDENLVIRLEQDFKQDFKDSKVEDAQLFKYRNWKLRLKETNARILAPFL
jgi:cardiolipin synthase